MHISKLLIYLLVLNMMVGCSTVHVSYAKNPNVILSTGKLNTVKHLLEFGTNKLGYKIDRMYKDGYETNLNDTKTVVVYKKTNKREEDFLLDFFGANKRLLNSLHTNNKGSNLNSINEKILIFFLGIKDNETLIIAHCGLRTRIKNTGIAINFIDITNTGTVTSELNNFLIKIQNKAME